MPSPLMVLLALPQYRLVWEVRCSKSVVQFALWHSRLNCPMNVNDEVEEAPHVQWVQRVLVCGIGELLKTFTSMWIHHHPPFGPRGSSVSGRHCPRMSWSAPVARNDPAAASSVTLSPSFSTA